MAPSILLNCEGITKSYGRRPLFPGLTFALSQGDHVGLVGPNGAGKSTLLKILAGVEAPDTGSCTRQKKLRVSYVPQHPAFAPGKTARQIVIESISGEEEDLGQESEQRAALALAKAGFRDHRVAADELSGGWRARLAIARALATAPDILLLDEPTNHLDLDSILWLEGLLRNEPKAFVVVSHDRSFLQNVASKMIEIDRVYRGGLLFVQGSYADLLEAREELLSNQASQQHSLANRVRREVDWLRRGAKARHSKSKARIQAAERSLDELSDSRERSIVRSAGIEFDSSGRKTKLLWSCLGLTKSFAGQSVVEGLDLLLTPGMRLAVLGPNGSGKTTLLRMIAGELEPDRGEIRRAKELRVVYFDQSRRILDPTLTLKRALAPEGDNVCYRERSLHVATWAKRFLFSPEQLETPVARLSGGERARTLLARLMLQPADLLVLDEPTNDLDIPTLDVLEKSLLEFSGALVLVTHDRYMIDSVSTEILVLNGSGRAERCADYDQWASIRQEEPRAPAPARAARPAKAKGLSFLEQREFAGMEEMILAAELRLAQARPRVEDPSIATDAAALGQRVDELASVQREVDQLYARWAELAEKSR